MPLTLPDNTIEDVTLSEGELVAAGGKSAAQMLLPSILPETSLVILESLSS
jgi:hypothetical protein